MAKIRQVTLDIYYENEEIMELILQRKELMEKEKTISEWDMGRNKYKIMMIEEKIAEKAGLFIPSPLMTRRVVDEYIKDMGVI